MCTLSPLHAFVRPLRSLSVWRGNRRALHVALPCESVVGRSKGDWMDGSANQTNHHALGPRWCCCLRPSPHILITLSGNVWTVWILLFLLKWFLLSRAECYKIAELSGSRSCDQTWVVHLEMGKKSRATHASQSGRERRGGAIIG